MTHPTNTQDLSIALPITQTARRIAQQFAQQQPTPETAEQVRLNTLAVLVINDYLQMLGIFTDLQASYSWNPVGRLGADVADLKVTGVGRLECRQIRVTERTCHIPPEVWSDRIGYVVVQIDESHREGKILGFVPTVTVAAFPISQLQPLEMLLSCLSRKASAIVHLRQWFNNIFETGWHTIEEVFGTREANLTLAFRSTGVNPNKPENIRQLINQLYISQDEDQRKIAAQRLGYIGERHPEAIAALIHLLHTTQNEETRWSAAESLWNIDPGNPASGVRRVTDLGIQLAGYAVALMVAILPKPDQTVAILLRLYPMGSQTELPPDLQLMGMDEDGNIFLEAQSRDEDNYIQLKFSGQPGEQFSVRVALGDASITENFVI